MVAVAVVARRITQEQYKDITGENPTVEDVAHLTKNVQHLAGCIFYARVPASAPGQFYGGGAMNNVCAAHQEVKEQFRDHEKRIVALEKADAEFAIRLQNLIEKIENLTGWIKALVVSIITTGVGFIIWYIQSLPR